MKKMFPLFLFLIFAFSFFSCGDCGNQTALFIFCEKDGSQIEVVSSEISDWGKGEKDAVVCKVDFSGGTMVLM